MQRGNRDSSVSHAFFVDSVLTPKAFHQVRFVNDIHSIAKRGCKREIKTSKPLSRHRKLSLATYVQHKNSVFPILYNVLNIDSC